MLSPVPHNWKGALNDVDVHMFCISVTNIDASLAFARGRHCSGRSPLQFNFYSPEDAAVSHDSTDHNLLL